jgi:hypothetical protein
LFVWNMETLTRQAFVSDVSFVSLQRNERF